MAALRRAPSEISEDDALAEGKHYYTARHNTWKTRTQSVSGGQLGGKAQFNGEAIRRNRRLSHDEQPIKPRKFLIDVDSTLRLVLEQEDTDGDFQICITDAGPKVYSVGTATSNGFKSFDIRGNWMLSVLLQELALAKDHGRKTIILHESRLSENPVTRLSRMIRTSFWDGLTRRIDAEGLEIICADPKNTTANQSPRIYVPEGEPEMYQYYKDVAKAKPHLDLQVDLLPKEFDARYVKDLNTKPGILALAMNKVTKTDGSTELQGIPFVVPGARFNELYNWDSYFISLGLLVDGRVDMAKGIVDHFIFQIKHYGKILNGNRSYYLSRSQPPFLTDFALQIYGRLEPENEVENKAWLKRAIQAAIKEYHNVWVCEPRLDPKTGLSRYRPDGMGVPSETEASHFTHILKPYADKHGIAVNELVQQYNDGEIHEPELDIYFLHDRAVRESGHDTYRFEKKCANLATIDLNSLLFKYECDIAYAIKEFFGDSLELEEDFELQSFPFGTALPFDASAGPASPEELDFESLKLSGRSSIGAKQTSSEWVARATRRRQLMDHYLWDAGKGMYTDYDTVKEKKSLYETVTCFWAMWSGAASEEQAAKMMKHALPKFEVPGGLVPGTEQSRGPIGLDRPNRQWDYPTAWPPHQILAWIGLDRYGYTEAAQRLAYRWTYMLTKGFVDYNGVVPEKVDAVAMSHFVTAEYGNQGLDFRHYNKEGFGWTNSSIQIGISFLPPGMLRHLGALTDPDTLFAPLPV